MNIVEPPFKKEQSNPSLSQCKLLSNSVNVGNCFISSHNRVVHTAKLTNGVTEIFGVYISGQTMGDHTFCFNGIENVTKLLNVDCAPNTFSGKHRVAT